MTINIVKTKQGWGGGQTVWSVQQFAVEILARGVCC